MQNFMWSIRDAGPVTLLHSSLCVRPLMTALKKYSIEIEGVKPEEIPVRILSGGGRSIMVLYWCLFYPRRKPQSFMLSGSLQGP